MPLPTMTNVSCLSVVTVELIAFPLERLRHAAGKTQKGAWSWGQLQAPLPGFKNVVGVIGLASLPGSPGPVPAGVRSSLTAWDVLPCWQLLQGI